MLASNINEVLVMLDKIITNAKAKKSTQGYFAALYKQVTRQVKQGIEEGRFEDAQRMDKLDTTFANRYLDALDGFEKGFKISKSWKIAFENQNKPQLIILQHLLLGMNAHINLDLGIASTQLGLENINALERDFNEINVILASMLDRVQEILGQLSPLIGIIDKLGGFLDESIANFSIKNARVDAWNFATLLSKQDPETQKISILLVDNKTTMLGRLIAEPGWILGKGIELIRYQESKDVVKIIEVLDKF